MRVQAQTSSVGRRKPEFAPPGVRSTPTQRGLRLSRPLSDAARKRVAVAGHTFEVGSPTRDTTQCLVATPVLNAANSTASWYRWEQVSTGCGRYHRASFLEPSHGPAPFGIAHFARQVGWYLYLARQRKPFQQPKPKRCHSAARPTPPPTGD
ncbi:hypothetical protein PCL_02932 [Purpureocillium lilacinum]|uniref:Uncharacterized protein n=1 Tax=Purpureocillium lilacinum TaxID=33203 RepID=A0A2U3DZ93_PURLI|nr:hypothetical protein Purlil1_6955 [Purpureocillium lilacinum]PWI67578.1 hypothetical protein PCL_02932 [Purpureocillium lilacinum]